MIPRNSIHTKAGRLTRYGLACGYVERRGDTGIEGERYAVLEQISSNGALRVQEGGRWTRDCIYLGTSLTAARKALAAWAKANKGK